MASKAGGINHMPSIIAPGDVQVIQPGCYMVSENPAQLSGLTSSPASSTVVQHGAGRTDLQKPEVMNQNPAGMAGHLQNQPMGILHPAGIASLQTVPEGIQYAPGTTIVLPPGDPQNPLSSVPGPTQTSHQPYWNMSFVQFPAFNPEKFINEEVKTLGAIQILIGLMHIFSGISLLVYFDISVTQLSGYLFWGGLSFTISGSLSVWTEKNPNTCMVNGSVGMNIVSAIFSLSGILFLLTDIFNSQLILMKAFAGCLLPFALLEFFLTCVVSHFGCKANCWVHFENMTVISTITSFNPANMTSGPVNATTSPVDTSMDPANPPTSLGSPPYPDYVPPELSCQNTAAYAKKPGVTGHHRYDQEEHCT